MQRYGRNFIVVDAQGHGVPLVQDVSGYGQLAVQQQEASDAGASLPAMFPIPLSSMLAANTGYGQQRIVLASDGYGLPLFRR